MNLDFGVIIEMIEKDFPDAEWVVRRDRRTKAYFGNIILPGREFEAVVIAHGRRFGFSRPETFGSYNTNPGTALFNAYILAMRAHKKAGHKP